MYIQLTTKCNMLCAHCCMNATSRGQNMSREVFDAAMKLIYNMGYTITLGGGEPTMHPMFDEFFGKALMASSASDAPIYIVTNGTDTNRANMLLRLSQNGIISGYLSIDQYHDMSMVDASVLSYAKAHKLVKTVQEVSKTGRGKDIASSKKTCACDSAIVKPNGDVWACLCMTHKFGNILDPDFSMGEFGDYGCCWESKYHPRFEREEACV